MATKKTRTKSKPKATDPIALLKEIEQTREKLRKLEGQVAGSLDASIKSVAEGLVKNIKIDWKPLQQLVFQKGVQDGIYDIEYEEPEEVEIQLFFHSDGNWEVELVVDGKVLAEDKF